MIRGSELNYGIYDLEILAAVVAMKFFRDMLHGIHFKLVCDNRAVSFIKNKKDLSGRIARAVMYMQEFSFDIEFRPSERNRDCDAFSRYPIGYKIINDKNINNEILNIAHTDAEKLDKYFINYLKFNSKVSFEKIGCIANKSIINSSAYTVCSVPHQTNSSLNGTLKVEQRQDFELNPIINALENREEIIVNNRSLTENFFIDNDILYKLKSNVNGNKLLVCIPKSLRLELLSKYHDLSTSSHLGTKRSLVKINERFYWKDMNSYIKNYVKSCHLCQIRKKPKLKPKDY